MMLGTQINQHEPHYSTYYNFFLTWVSEPRQNQRELARPLTAVAELRDWTSSTAVDHGDPDLISIHGPSQSVLEHGSDYQRSPVWERWENPPRSEQDSPGAQFHAAGWPRHAARVSLGYGVCTSIPEVEVWWLMPWRGTLGELCGMISWFVCSVLFW